MKNKMQKIMLVAVIAATVPGQANALGARRGSMKAVAKESPAMQVDKQVSVLDQIVEQANIIVKTETDKTRAAAKRELKRLMKDLKELDPETYDVINETVEKIQAATAKNKADTKKAYDSLIAVINAMDAQANVIDTMEEGRIAIELAPADMKQEVIAQQVQNVQAAQAQAEQAGLMNRMVGGIQSTLAKPGNYFFGEQRTAAKTAFEAAVGVAVAGGLSYLAYKYTPEGTAAGAVTRAQDLYSRGKKYFGFGKEEPLKEEPQIKPLRETTFRELPGELYNRGKAKTEALLNTTPASMGKAMKERASSAKEKYIAAPFEKYIAGPTRTRQATQAANEVALTEQQQILIDVKKEQQEKAAEAKRLETLAAEARAREAEAADALLQADIANNLAKADATLRKADITLEAARKAAEMQQSINENGSENGQGTSEENEINENAKI